MTHMHLVSLFLGLFPTLTPLCTWHHILNRPIEPQATTDIPTIGSTQDVQPSEVLPTCEITRIVPLEVDRAQSLRHRAHDCDGDTVPEPRPTETTIAHDQESVVLTCESSSSEIPTDGIHDMVAIIEPYVLEQIRPYPPILERPDITCTTLLYEVLRDHIVPTIVEAVPKTSELMLPRLTSTLHSSATLTWHMRDSSHSLAHRAYPRTRRVYVPRTELHDRCLTSDDTLVWIDSHRAHDGASHGWLASRRSLEAHGFYAGHRQIWVPRGQVVVHPTSIHRHFALPRAKIPQ
jgi:hypothetical protein